MGPASIEEVERTNTVMVYPNNRTEFVLCNLYTMNINRDNQNCYNCREFGHLARNYRNRRIGNRIGEGRRLEYGQNNRQRLMIDNEQDNLNREEIL